MRTMELEATVRAIVVGVFVVLLTLGAATAAVGAYVAARYLCGMAR